MDIGELLYDIFGKRIAEGGQFSPVEYLIYGAIMLALAFFVIFPVLDRRGIKFDLRFAMAIIPFILLGSLIHVLEDMALIPTQSANPLELGFWFVTPGIWILVATITIATLVIAKYLESKTKYSFHLLFAATGLIPSILIMLFIMSNFGNWPGFLGSLAIVAGITAVAVLGFNKLTKLKLLRDKFNILVTVSQLIGSVPTFIAVEFFGYGEQHPISDIILKFFPFSFVLIKLGLVLLILHYVDIEIENENLRGFIKIVVLILGLATGLRDLFRLGIPA
ncbi:MAG: hypothetical protein CL943_00035 [Candidatus Diapherotrites archaeon]|uniref:DUF63 family protein n=1 Tax=Candidatus Iainarchaeum sp. TaxID=3101447 RepID=A0A2D6LZV7_9ARCH|nr:hypothetical protein [Candidatus Diapherotrites archaeon]